MDGDGSISRDFTYVENNVDANLKACTAPLEAIGEVINIATSQEVSLDQLVEKINGVLGTSIKPTYKQPRLGDIEHSLADISKANKIIGYKPTVDFEEGLRRTIAFYKKSLIS